MRGDGSSADKCRRQRKRIDLQRNAFGLELVGDDLRNQFLFKLANIDKLDANAGIIKAVKRLADSGR